jgi:dockerin type I repeat protein
MRRANHIEAGLVSVVLAAVSLLGSDSIVLAAGPESRQVEQLRKLMRALPDGALPLYVLGDLNEDGKVDHEELRILAEYIASQKKNAPPPRDLRCIAAADVNRDGKVDSVDLAMLKDWLTRVPELSVPALYWSRQSLPAAGPDRTVRRLHQHRT